MRFQAPQLGALGVAFTTLRAFQFFSLVAIIGLTANFINEIVEAQREAPDVLIGTLTVVSETPIRGHYSKTNTANRPAPLRST